MIRIDHLNIRLTDFRLRDINLSVAENAFFVLMGPTGAGKTVLLEAIAGLIPLKSGRIYVRDREINGLPPEKRGVGIVYQDHALFPHLTVMENIMYGLHFHRTEKAEAEKRCGRLIDILNLSHILKRLPTNLSGGEKQRVALARALVVQPEVLLLDEPLSALDPNFREEIRNALKALHRSSKITFLMVTHDFGEALFLADGAAVINKGCIEQSGDTMDVFQRPASPFVAEFVGMKNIFSATFNGNRVVLGDVKIDLGVDVNEPKKYLAIRPEDIRISKEPMLQDSYNTLKGKVIGMSDNGFYCDVSIKTGSVVFRASATRGTLWDMHLTDGVDVYLNWRPSSMHVF